MPGPGYTIKDLVFFSAFVGGACLVYLATGEFVMHRFVRFGITVFAGAGLGWFAQNYYERSKRNKDLSDDDL